MSCYIIPIIAAILTFFGRRTYWNGVHGFWLNIMFLGGGIFGGIDHLWNGELFITTNLAMDLALGGLITGGIALAWGMIVSAQKINISGLKIGLKR
jgi:hypothetical protein